MELRDPERAIRSWGGFAKYRNELLTMSAIWSNSENIYSLRVLPLMTQTGPSSSSNDRPISRGRPYRVPCEREYLFGGGDCQPINTLSSGRWTSTLSG